MRPIAAAVVVLAIFVLSGMLGGVIGVWLFDFESPFVLVRGFAIIGLIWALLAYFRNRVVGR